jgi:hypothetical protein
MLRYTNPNPNKKSNPTYDGSAIFGRNSEERSVKAAEVINTPDA